MEQKEFLTGITRKHAERHGDYNAFLERHSKNTAGKNTDELYTPPAVYEAVLEWVKTNCPSIHGKRIMRPFRPGGDYKAEDYTGAVVVDNPPFFIEHFITRWYVDNCVPFFLFAPAITLFRGSSILDKRLQQHTAQTICSSISSQVCINTLQMLQKKKSKKHWNIRLSTAKNTRYFKSTMLQTKTQCLNLLS